MDSRRYLRVNGKRNLRPKNMRLTPREWMSGFKDFIHEHPQYSNVFETLVRSGCEEDAIIEFLHMECYDRPHDKPFKRPELRDLFDKTARVALEAELLSKRAQAISWFVLSQTKRTDEEDFYVVTAEDGTEQRVPMRHYENFPMLLRSYAQLLKGVAHQKPDVSKIELQGPEVSILALYIEEVMKQSPFGIVTDLLCAATAFTGKEGNFSEDALRIRVRRYKKEHPQTVAKIEQLLKKYLARPKAKPGTRDELTLMIYEGLYCDPEIKDIVRRP
jgi:hypothetical protein